MKLNKNVLLIIGIILFAGSIEEIFNSSNVFPILSNLPCADVGPNGSLIFQDCSFIHGDQHIAQCRSLFTPLKFWGVSIVIFASFIYILPYFTIVIFYCIMPDLRRKSYDKGVMCFCFGQLSTAAILCILGYFILCYKKIAAIVYSLVGLTLMFLTISSVLWMCILCFDITLTITRFKWAPSSNTHDENRKFRVYSCWAYGGASLPTAFASILELVPLVPKNWSIKPNFEQFNDTNIAVMVYVMSIPLLVCLTNSVLFFYTTWKILKIEQSTSIAEENRKDSAKKKYTMYLKLYLLMDAPWITSALAAFYPNLWILKLVRIVHPILLLITILPRNMIIHSVKCTKKTNFSKNIVTRENLNTVKETNLCKDPSSPENV